MPRPCPGHAQAMPRPWGLVGFPFGAAKGFYFWILWKSMDHYGSSSCQLHQLEGQDETAGHVKKIPRSMPGRYDYSEVEKDLYRCGFSVLQSYAQYVAMPMMLQVQLFVTTHLCKNRGSVSKFPKYQQLAFGRIWFKVNVARSGSLNGLPRLVGRCRVFFDLKWLRRFQMVLKWGIIADSHSLHHSL